VGAGLLVQRLGSQVDAAGPGDGACIGIEDHLREEGGVVQRLKDAGPPPQLRVCVRPARSSAAGRC
jgi:hypothetical protein